LNPGDHIRTAAGSIAAMVLPEDRVITISESSQVALGDSNSAPIVQLESGSMKVFSPSDILVAAKDTLLQTADKPLDMELGYQGDKLNLTVFNGAVREGSITIRGGNQDARTRTITADSRSARRNDVIVPNPNFYIYPYFLYGNRNPNDGRIVPPV